MALHEKNEKQPKRRSRAGIVLLALLLIILGAAGYFYYSMVKAPLALDDPRQMAASAPMSPEERFQFSASDGTVRVKLDKSDLWSLILAHAGEDFLDAINAELSGYDLSVSGCAIHMEEEGLRLDLELFFRETRLVVKVPCELTVSGQKFALTPTAVKLGAIPLPVARLISSVNLEYELALPVLSEVTQISFTEDALLLTGSMEQDIQNLMPGDKTLYQTVIFRESFENVLQAKEGYASLLSSLEQNPGKLENLYRELFVLAEPEVKESYLAGSFGMTQRFFPGIDFAAAAAEQTALSEEVTPVLRSLEQFFTSVVNEYNSKNFKLSNGEFLLKRKPFQAATYGKGKYDALFEQLNPEDIFLILVDAQDGFVRKTSSFYRMADEKQQFTQDIDFNKTYILGCVFRSVGGRPFLMYESEVQENNTYSRSITLRPLTEAEVTALQVPGVFGVWTNK